MQGDEDEEEEQESTSSEEEYEPKKKIVDIVTEHRLIQDPNLPLVQRVGSEVLPEPPPEDPFLTIIEVAERGYVNKRTAPEDEILRPTISQYQIRLGLEDKFKSVVVKELIHSVLNDELAGKVYSEKEAEVWTKKISNDIRTKVRDMGFSRYKFVVQCVLGEEHGAGVKIGSRCLWDADTDNYACDTFLNETIFCMTAVYGIYYY